MKHTLLPIKCKIFYILLLGVSPLFISCNSEPILLNPNGGYEYYKKSFDLDTSNTYSIQGQDHTGYSSRLYSGMLPSGSSVNTVIKFIPSIVDTAGICNADSIIDIKFRLFSTKPLTFNNFSNSDSTYLDTLLFKSYFIDTNEIMDINESTIFLLMGSINAKALIKLV